MCSYHFHVTSVLYLRYLTLATPFHAHSFHPLGRVLFPFLCFLFSLPHPTAHFLFHIYVSLNVVAIFLQIFYEHKRHCCG